MSTLGSESCALRTVIVPPAAIVAALSIGQGPAGPAGPAGSVSDYRHTQASASAVWTINHNLARDVSVTLYTPGGVEFDAEIVQTSPNQCLALLAAPAAGYARVI